MRLLWLGGREGWCFADDGFKASGDRVTKPPRSVEI